ncbi:hypothetical protein [Methanococcoides vulcani]|uniref:hypothetical protein n=1 Tax=Methanococcoides vulcani TaxID=1353158 RepID=UPI0010841662|nr:hypothetical protein [Methanococcoides vulcani]
MDLHVFLRDWHYAACMKHFAGFHFETFNVGMTAFIVSSVWRYDLHGLLLDAICQYYGQYHSIRMT